MRRKGACWIATLSGALLVTVGVTSGHAAVATLEITVDENGNGSYSASSPDPPLTGTLFLDPVTGVPRHRVSL